jgi:prepilin-type N-terminal cleavage/methylation domain-containing protein
VNLKANPEISETQQVQLPQAHTSQTAIISCWVKRKGFTLVELLTVIGIIVIIAAIAFPIFGKVRDAGLSAASIGSMRQLGAILGTVAAENNNSLPVGFATGKGNYQRRLTDYGISEFGTTTDTSNWLKAFQNKLATVKEKFKSSTNVWIGATPYGVNKRLSDGITLYGNQAAGTVSMYKLPRPSATVFLGDGTINTNNKSAGSQLDPNNPEGSGESISFRHSGKKAALMFADWHIALMTKDEVDNNPGLFNPALQK